jgi:hypothetical protein
MRTGGRQKNSMLPGEITMPRAGTLSRRCRPILQAGSPAIQAASAGLRLTNGPDQTKTIGTRSDLMRISGFARRLLAGLVVLLAANAFGAGEFGGYEPKTGDVVFQSLGRSPLIEMIEGSTKSPYSHCGLVAQKDGQWIVIEAIGPVRELPLAEWIRNGRHDGFAAYRLKGAYAGKADAVVKAARTFLGKPYDIHYELDDAKIYCSELVFKAFRLATGENLGRLTKLKELDWKPFEPLIKQIENGDVPLEREIITPVAVARARQLEKVFSRDIAESNESTPARAQP